MKLVNDNRSRGDKLDAWNYPLKDGSSGYYRRYDRTVIIEYRLLGIYCLRSIQLQR